MFRTEYNHAYMIYKGIIGQIAYCSHRNW